MEYKFLSNFKSVLLIKITCINQECKIIIKIKYICNNDYHNRHNRNHKSKWRIKRFLSDPRHPSLFNDPKKSLDIMLRDTKIFDLVKAHRNSAWKLYFLNRHLLPSNSLCVTFSNIFYESWILCCFMLKNLWLYLLLYIALYITLCFVRADIKMT